MTDPPWQTHVGALCLSAEARAQRRPLSPGFCAGSPGSCPLLPLPSKTDLSSPSWAFPRAEAGNTGPECLFRPGRAPGRRGGNSHKMFVQVGVRFPTREEEGGPEEPAESAQ